MTEKDDGFVYRELEPGGTKVGIDRATFEREDKTLHHYALSFVVMTMAPRDSYDAKAQTLAKGFVDAFTELHRNRLVQFMERATMPRAMCRYEEHLNELKDKPYEEVQRMYLSSLGVHACKGGKR